MITYKQFKEKLDIVQRKAAQRRMALLAKKPSTQKKREKGKLKPWSAKKIHSKALKMVRKFAMQKAARWTRVSGGNGRQALFFIRFHWSAVIY